MIAKPRPKLLDKRKKKAEQRSLSEIEDAKVKKRSGGRCEVQTVKPFLVLRCPFRAAHVHHLISGIGRRNVGRSLEADCKLNVCARCHEEIHGHVLKPVNDYERESAATVRWERVE